MASRRHSFKTVLTFDLTQAAVSGSAACGARRPLVKRPTSA